MEAALFFIALIPDPALCEEVTRFKKYAAEQFGSSRALRSPPHITLFPPFKWPASRVEELSHCLADFAAREKSFLLSLSGFDSFAPRVIFVKVNKSHSLQALQSRLRDHLASGLGLRSRDDRPYHPHITVAFKDLRRSAFHDAWAHFSPLVFERTFRVGSLTLLEHNGREWENYQEFNFQGEGSDKSLRHLNT